MSKFQKVLLAFSVALSLTTVALLSQLNGSQRVIGSVTQSSEYHSTSTKDQLGNTMADLTVLQSTPGTLGSLVITDSNATIACFFDATTTNATLRTNTATTTLGCISGTPAEGTYTFDTVFYYGLILDYNMLGTTGGMPTSTITFR